MFWLYTKGKGASPVKEEDLLYLFTCIQAQLDEEENLNLADILCSLCSHKMDYNLLHTDLTSDLASDFLGRFLSTGFELGYLESVCMQRCFYLFLSTKISDSQLQIITMQTRYSLVYL